MDTILAEKVVVKTKNGHDLTIAPGTEKNVTYGEMLSFWETVWAETESLRPTYSVVEDFLFEKRVKAGW